MSGRFRHVNCRQRAGATRSSAPKTVSPIAANSPAWVDARTPSVLSERNNKRRSAIALRSRCLMKGLGAAGMDFALDAGQRAWLAEVREFLHDNVTAELQAELARHDLEFPN